MLLALAAPAGAVERIKVSKQFAGQLKLAVPLFSGQGEEGARQAPSLTNLLIDDLILSGYFAKVENRQFVEEAERMDRSTGRINLKEWAATGADFLIKGNFSAAGGSLRIGCQVTDLRQGRNVYNQAYSIAADSWRQVIHRLADEITWALTGEKGLARTRIAFVSSDHGERKIYAMDGCGQDWRKIDSGRGIAINPDWTPDGRALVYTSYASGFPWIFYDNLDTGRRTVVSSFPGLNAFPAVSRDGKWLAFTLSKDGNNEIYKMRTDRTGLQRLTFSRGNDCSPSWSPDGSRIVFVSDRGGTPEIYIMDAEGKNPRRLPAGGGYNTSPAWSPRGDMIAFTSRKGGKFQIQLYNPTSGSLEQLTRDSWNNEDPSWAPDNRHLVYSSRRGGGTNLFVIDILNPEPIQLTQGRDCTSPSWGPYLY